MCDGDLNTQLSDVQFGMKMVTDDVDLSDISAVFNFPYITRTRGFSSSSKIITLPYLNNRSYTISHKSYSSLTELFDEVCEYYTH